MLTRASPRKVLLYLYKNFFFQKKGTYIILTGTIKTKCVLLDSFFPLWEEEKEIVVRGSFPLIQVRTMYVPSLYPSERRKPERDPFYSPESLSLYVAPLGVLELAIFCCGKKK